MSTAGVAVKFNEPFYTGTGVSSGVAGSTGSGEFMVAIDGRDYLAVMNNNQLFGQHFHEASLQTIRQQADTSGQPAEASITPEGLWRRAMDDFSHGAGQTYRDRPGSDALQYRSSKGLNPWSKWQMSLLHDTTRKRTSANSNLQVLVVGSYLYLLDGQQLLYTQDVTVANPTWTVVTGNPAVTAQGMASDGFNIWIAYGSSGLYSTTRGAASMSSGYITGSPTINGVGYQKGRLLVTSGASLYNITSSGAALPTALFTRQPANSDWSWVGFTEGPGQIYFAGFSGDISYIYRTNIVSDGTTLNAPVIAGVLPSGEVVRGIIGYAGFLLIGSDKGLRLAEPDSNGNLTIGALITGPASIQAFTGQDRFVYFGWSNYDGTSTGLGRADLSVFPTPLQPAYASDLMASTQGTVSSCATFQSLTLFTVLNSGVWVQSTNLVSSGTMDSGYITYGLPDAKVAMYLNLVTAPLAGSIDGFLSVDAGPFNTIGTFSTVADVTASLNAQQTRGRTHEVRLTLNRSASDTTTGPTLDRWTLQAYPAPSMGRSWIVPVILHEEINLDGYSMHLDVVQERQILEALYDSHQLVNFQVGTETFPVFVDDLQWLPHHQSTISGVFNGTMVLTLKYLPSA